MLELERAAMGKFTSSNGYCTMYGATKVAGLVTYITPEKHN